MSKCRGLEPGREYWYRFIAGGEASPIGRLRTAPPPGAPLDRLRFGFASCANYELGYFSAYRHLTEENPDLVLFLGDYIYEYVSNQPNKVREHSDGVDAIDLRTYRNRYAQYRTDPDLRALHAATPCLAIWDDHEVQNDYADFWSQNFDDPLVFLKRRAAAYQAYWEHMPLPLWARPRGPDMTIFCRHDYGALATFLSRRRAAIPLAPGLRQAAERRRQADHRRGLPGAPRPAPLVSRQGAGSLALPRVRQQRGALELPRPGPADGRVQGTA